MLVSFDAFIFLCAIGFLIAGLDANYSSLIAPGCIFLLLFVLCIAIQISIRNRSKNDKKTTFVNPYLDCSVYETGILPTINYPNLRLNPNEILYFASPANTFVSKEQVVGYSGGSGGMSVRLAKGITYHSGKSKGSPIRRDVIKYNPGDYIVTNQRLVFIGLKDSFDIPVSKVTAVKPIAKDAFIILKGNTQENIQIDTSQTVYALAMTNQAIDEQSNA